jgi:hypothetical protein
MCVIGEILLQICSKKWAVQERYVLLCYVPVRLILYDTSLYVMSRRFYVPVRFIPEVWDHIQG